MGFMELLVERSASGYVGKPIPRLVDGYEKVSGRAEYIFDMELPGMLYGVILRSEVPHGFIRELDYSALLKHDFIKAVISGRDVKVGSVGPLRDQPVLKYPKVRSMLDEVLVAAGTDQDKVVRALDEVRVSYEQLTPVFDAEEALKSGAPLIHEENGSNLVQANFDFSCGGVDKVFEDAPYVREDTYEVPRVAFAPMGTLGAISYLDQSGNLVLVSNTQEPFQLKRELAEALGINPQLVRVFQPYVGGNFGRGMDLYPFEVAACILTLKTRRPVKILYTRTDDFRYSPTRQPAKIRLKSAATRDGRLLARKAEVTLDAGAYVSWGVFDARVMAATVTGLYRVGAVEFRARAAYTNNPYTINMRGAGNPQMTFALESHMDSMAHELGVDPVEFRLINAYEGDYTTPQGMKVRDARLRSVIGRCAELINWRGAHTLEPKDSKRYGIGFAALFHVGGGARVYRTDGAGALIKLDDFGTATLYTGMSEMGQGTVNSLAQIVATELGVPIERVRVEYRGDVDGRPWDTATHASRSTFVSGNAAILAARKLKRELLREASKTLGVKSSELYIEGGFVRSKSGGVELPLDKLVRRAHFRNNGKTFTAYAYYDPKTEMLDSNNKGNISAAYVNAAQAALVEVDVETGEVRVLRVVSVHDIGQPINPLGARGQIVGGIVQGIGHALYEELVVEGGSVQTVGFGDYEVPSVGETPEIHVEFLPTKDRYGPFGARGVAENGIIPIAAAIANAVYDATGVRVRSIPIKRDVVFNALHRRG
ncbi:MAG: xanthine dehydrogenase family protein molybdopterin-binding subunit [Thermoprotei archaeon]